MINNNHPITPPPELVKQWAHDHFVSSGWTDASGDASGIRQAIAIRAARWGADQELEACCEAFEDIWDQEDVVTLNDVLRGIRAARRPKLPSLKELNLKHLEVMERDGHYLPEIISDLRRAIESLPD